MIDDFSAASVLVHSSQVCFSGSELATSGARFFSQSSALSAW
jgi:hypothetical protein